LLSQGTRPATPDADLESVDAHMLATVEASVTASTTKHRVAGDPPSEPFRWYCVAQRRDLAAPLMTKAKRVFGVALVKVGHDSGEELDVGAADTHSVHIDDDFTGPGNWWIDVPHFGLEWTGQYERAHTVQHVTALTQPSGEREALSYLGGLDAVGDIEFAQQV
jgi:hypothetical protein